MTFGRIQPSGSRKIRNQGPRAWEVPPLHLARTRKERKTPSVTSVLLALFPDPLSGYPLPLFHRCLPQAELLHRSLLSRLGSEGPQCPELLGRDEKGQPLEGHHHAHYLPLDLDEDDRIDHIFVHVPMGLGNKALSALQEIGRTWTKESDRDILLTCVGVGDLPALLETHRTRRGDKVSILGTGKDWRSRTPFLCPRHRKARNHTLGDQIRSELRSRGFPPPSKIETFSRRELVSMGFLHFVRRRAPGKPQPPCSTPFGVRLRFEEPVTGPLCLGYASHFGLGLFELE